MEIEKLKSLEKSQDIINKYVGISSFGKNRIVYLPMLIGIGLLMFVVMVFLGNVTETIGMPIIIGLIAVSILCFVMVKIISNATKKKLLLETKSAPTCIGKIVVGNDMEKVYHCIYTTEEHRHDEQFVDDIADKIWAAISNPSGPVEHQVVNLFRPDFIKPNEFSKKLPLLFTENKEVWTKQVSFKLATVQIMEQIKADEDKFAMVAIVAENARFLSDYYAK